MRELILGGQKSGKSRAAERRASDWLRAPGRDAVLLATASAGDAEMADRIERHRRDRRLRAPGLKVVQAAASLVDALRSEAGGQRLLVVDCLTLWLTQIMFPIGGAHTPARAVDASVEDLTAELHRTESPWIVVSNEIGLGVIPPTAESREFLDRIGSLHQHIAALADRVTLLVAGCECRVKEPGT